MRGGPWYNQGAIEGGRKLHFTKQVIAIVLRKPGHPGVCLLYTSFVPQAVPAAFLYLVIGPRITGAGCFYTAKNEAHTRLFLIAEMPIN